MGMSQHIVVGGGVMARECLHQSAHWNIVGYQQGVSMRLLYVNRPDPSGERQVLPNDDR